MLVTKPPPSRELRAVAGHACVVECHAVGRGCWLPQGHQCWAGTPASFEQCVLNYAFNDLYECIPTGARGQMLTYDCSRERHIAAKQRNFYGVLQWINRYPKTHVTWIPCLASRTHSFTSRFCPRFTAWQPTSTTWIGACACGTIITQSTCLSVCSLHLMGAPYPPLNGHRLPICLCVLTHLQGTHHRLWL